MTWHFKNSGSGILPRPSCEPAKGATFASRSPPAAAGYIHVPGFASLWLIPIVACVSVIAWAAFTPVQVDSREKVFAIPEGTWARRRAGDNVDILPSQIRLTLGLQDVLLLKNRDVVPQTFGPALLMPGQNFRLPFEVASDYQFACTAHSSGQMTVVVDPFPGSPFARVVWRARRVIDSIRYPSST